MSQGWEATTERKQLEPGLGHPWGRGQSERTALHRPQSGSRFERAGPWGPRDGEQGADSAGWMDLRPPLQHPEAVPIPPRLTATWEHEGPDLIGGNDPIYSRTDNTCLDWQIRICYTSLYGQQFCLQQMQTLSQTQKGMRQWSLLFILLPSARATRTQGGHA